MEGSGPGRGPPSSAWSCAAVCAGSGPLSRAGTQLDVRVSTGGLPLLGLTRCCLCAPPGDTHALCQRVVGVLQTMPVADCVRVAGSLGRL